MTELQAKEKIQKLMAVANCSTTNPNEAATAKNMAAKVAEKNSLMTWFFLTFVSAPPSVKKESVPVKLFTINTENFKPAILSILYGMSLSFFGECYIHEKGNKNIKSFSIKCNEDNFKAICKAGSELTKAFRKYRKNPNKAIPTGSNMTYEFKKYVMQGFHNVRFTSLEAADVINYDLGYRIRQDLNSAKKGGAR